MALSGGKLVSKRDASRTVSIADAMRHGAVDRIEQDDHRVTLHFADGSTAELGELGFDVTLTQRAAA